jgi:hypothetical protein
VPFASQICLQRLRNTVLQDAVPDSVPDPTEALWELLWKRLVASFAVAPFRKVPSL